MHIETLELSVTKTINLGNYESMKVQVGATISTTEEELETDTEELSAWLKETLTDEIQKHTAPTRVTRKRPPISDDY